MVERMGSEIAGRVRGGAVERVRGGIVGQALGGGARGGRGYSSTLEWVEIHRKKECLHTFNIPNAPSALAMST